MPRRPDVFRKLGFTQVHWIDRCQLVVVLLFLAIYAMVIVLWVVAAPVELTTDTRHAPVAVTKSGRVPPPAAKPPQAP